MYRPEAINPTDIAIYRVQYWMKNSQPIVNTMLKYQAVHAPTLVNVGYAPSELPLCAVTRDIVLPPGFTTVPTSRGRVHVLDWNRRLNQTFEHSFAHNGDCILCFTFGQFLDYQLEYGVPNIPGKRIDYYSAKAPHLITHLGNGVAALCGRRDEIYNKLGLIYEEQTDLNITQKYPLLM